MPKTLLSKIQRQKMRDMIGGATVINPREDLGWMLGVISALLDHAELMDERSLPNFPGDGDHSDRRGNG